MKKLIFSLVFCAAIIFSHAQTDLKTYNNYDFVSGENILFEDNFTNDAQGEFPSHWNLKSGQGVVNTIDGKVCFLLTQGNYAKVFPLMKNDNYLTDPFTVEFDFYVTAYSPVLFFKAKDKDTRDINFGFRVNTDNFSSVLSETYPEGTDALFKKKWHHAALAYKNGQMKCYVDQYRVLVIPQCGFVPEAILLGGIGSKDNPIVFTNVRIAEGGSMNMLNKILTDGKFVTHAITFDVNKSTIKPESMGFLNSLLKFLQDNKALKLEIDGHTDSDGDDASNQKLSEARANAVKTFLVSAGIDASRLTVKGFGETKPVADNNTLEGKAMNRRVEFIKQ
jgi:outer membrane protein OmpA-like peptidoglycan-associated protein